MTYLFPRHVLMRGRDGTPELVDGLADLRPERELLIGGGLERAAVQR